uniref:Uncharacterized protein LOC100186737 n=1 Tax=Phallusia mammillata TaxID=59560 RepID=A0A6F9DHT3_9ASCI|nr:uncharacterized protein LOC100186737 [Phallusia mammillata]
MTTSSSCFNFICSSSFFRMISLLIFSCSSLRSPVSTTSIKSSSLSLATSPPSMFSGGFSSISPSSTSPSALSMISMVFSASSWNRACFNPSSFRWGLSPPMSMSTSLMLSSTLTTNSSSGSFIFLRFAERISLFSFSIFLYKICVLRIVSLSVVLLQGNRYSYVIFWTPPIL